MRMRRAILLTGLALSAVANPRAYGFSNGFVGMSNFNGTYACHGSFILPGPPVESVPYVDSLQPDGLGGFRGGKRTVYTGPGTAPCIYTLVTTGMSASKFTPLLDRLTGNGMLSWSGTSLGEGSCPQTFSDNFSFVLNADGSTAQIANNLPILLTATAVSAGTSECVQ